MKQTIDLIFKRTDAGCVFTDRDGVPVRPEEVLGKIYAPRKGSVVLVRLKADDGRHEPLPFSLETLRAVQGHRVKGAFSTRGGQKVNVYTSNIKGDWPVMGSTWDGTGLRWDAEGNPDNGDPRCALCILGETEPPAEFLEDTESTGEEEEKPEG